MSRAVYAKGSRPKSPRPLSLALGVEEKSRAYTDFVLSADVSLLNVYRVRGHLADAQFLADA